MQNLIALQQCLQHGTQKITYFCNIQLTSCLDSGVTPQRLKWYPNMPFNVKTCMFSIAICQYLYIPACSIYTPDYSAYSPDEFLGTYCHSTKNII